MMPDADRTIEIGTTPVGAESPRTDPTADIRPKDGAMAETERPTLDRPPQRPWRIPALAFMVGIVLVATRVPVSRTSPFGARTIILHGASHLTRSNILRLAGIEPG